jgi:hypothetical protein
MPPAHLAFISREAARGKSGFVVSVMPGVGQPGLGDSRLALYRNKRCVNAGSHPMTK